MLEYHELLIPLLKEPICSINTSKTGPSDEQSKQRDVPQQLGHRHRAEAAFFKLMDSSHRTGLKRIGTSKKQFAHVQNAHTRCILYRHTRITQIRACQAACTAVQSNPSAFPAGCQLRVQHTSELRKQDCTGRQTSISVISNCLCL